MNFDPSDRNMVISVAHARKHIFTELEVSMVSGSRLIDPNVGGETDRRPHSVMQPPAGRAIYKKMSGMHYPLLNEPNPLHLESSP